MSRGRYPEVAFAAVRLGPSQVASVGLLPKKGVVQVAYSTGTGGKTCSSISCSSASLAMLLTGAPAMPQQVLAPPKLFITMLSNTLWAKLLNNLPGGCTASLQSLQQHMEQARWHLQAPCKAGHSTAAVKHVKFAPLEVKQGLLHTSRRLHVAPYTRSCWSACMPLTAFVKSSETGRGWKKKTDTEG